MQALSYFLIKNFISDYHVINSFLNFPYIKFFIYFYDSWYPFIFLCVLLIYKFDRKNYSKIILTMILAAILANITFIVYPSMIIRPNIEVKTFTDWLIDFTYKNDTPAVNCLPSMHCVSCFIICYYISRVKNLNIKYKSLIIIYSFIIVLSTLFIKQHVIEDAILALIYTIISIIIIHIILKRKKIEF